MANYNQLGYGSKGSEVTELQKLLNQNGYGLDVDGDFGSKTQAAVKDYQQKNNLAVDGIVGSNTWGALTKANTAGSAATSTPTQNPGFQYGSYQESDAVKQAQALLQQQMTNKPGEYQSQWQTQLNDTLQKILDREKFSYDLNGDALYQQYKDQAMTQGQQAMMDTMGQAQAMTGGYGNSYAQSVGQQAYQGYMQQLNDKIPELYQLALSKYQMEGDEIKDQAALIAQMEDQAYGRHRDTVADYNTELDRLQNQYDTERDYDYSKWADNRDFSYGQFSDDRAYDYQTGRDQVSDKQWQAEFDEAVRRWEYDQGISDADGNRVKKKVSVTTPASNPNPTPTPQPNPEPEPQPTGSDFTGSTYSEAVAYMKANGVSSSEASGVMTQSEWQRRKNAGSGSAEVKNYSSYKDYLADYVEYKTSK